MRSKSDFKALRELVGMSQQVLADLLDVTVRSVKRWESPDMPNMAPEEAWDILDRYRALQVQVIEYAIDKIESQGEGFNGKVDLTYWRSEDEYEAAHPDEGWGWQMANANSRLVADYLMREGYEVSFNFSGLRSLQE